MTALVSRTEAMLQGLTNYYTGRPCKRGHVAERNVKGKHCIECRSLSLLVMRERLGEEAWNAKERARNMDYIRRNRDKKRATARASMAKAYAIDPDRFIKRSNAFEQELMKSDPIRARLSQAARRAAYNVRKCGTISTRGLTAVVRRVWEKCGGKCAVCNSENDLELDHIVAMANGGSNEEFNLQFLCEPCNRSKGAKDFNEWLGSRSERELAA